LGYNNDNSLNFVITVHMYKLNSFKTMHYLQLHNCKGGRTRADKIGVGAGGDIVVATSTTQVWCKHTPTKSVSAPARRSIS